MITIICYVNFYVIYSQFPPSKQIPFSVLWNRPIWDKYNFYPKSWSRHHCNFLYFLHKNIKHQDKLPLTLNLFTCSARSFSGGTLFRIANLPAQKMKLGCWNDYANTYIASWNKILFYFVLIRYSLLCSHLHRHPSPFSLRILYN